MLPAPKPPPPGACCGTEPLCPLLGKREFLSETFKCLRVASLGNLPLLQSSSLKGERGGAKDLAFRQLWDSGEKE